MNLMPPFSYEKEDISFKSFNSKYLCWFFDHKYSQELYNIFISKSFDELLNLIMKDYEINEESEDYKLLKIYINTMPMIYGDDTGSTTFSSNIAESDVAKMEQFMQIVATRRAAEEAKVKQFINTIQK
jgi:hypothetical protein